MSCRRWNEGIIELVFPIIAPCVSFNGVIPIGAMKWFIGFQYSSNIVQNAVTVFHQSTVMAKINRNNQNVQRHAARSVFILKSLRKKIKLNFKIENFVFLPVGKGTGRVEPLYHMDISFPYTIWTFLSPIPYGHFWFCETRSNILIALIGWSGPPSSPI